MPGRNFLQLPKFTNVSDLMEIPGCQLNFWGLYGLEQCEVPAVFAVGFWDLKVQEPVICCAGHVSQAITDQLKKIPAEAVFEPGIVHVWKISMAFLAEYNHRLNQDSGDDTVQSTQVEGMNCLPRTQIETSEQSQQRYRLP